MSVFEVYNVFDVCPTYASGMYVYDENNVRYLDFYGGHAVISIGHSHPYYVKQVSKQLEKIGFYSNAVKNPLQLELAREIGRLSGLADYNLFLCNSGAEANENALKLASFNTNRSKILALKNSFHGRTSAAVAATDNPSIKAPLNSSHQVDFIELNDTQAAVNALKTETYAAVILETIQGVGGLDEGSTAFYNTLATNAKRYGSLVIADEIQSGFGRTGDFFAFQKHGIEPDIISMAKGMGNGFPVGGILINPTIKAKLGQLGTTFGGNHLACAAAVAVIKILSDEKLMQNAVEISDYIKDKAAAIPEIKTVKGRGLMLGLNFDFPISNLRNTLLYKHHIFTGNSKNPNLIRLLPPLIINKAEVDLFFNALSETLSTLPIQT